MPDRSEGMPPSYREIEKMGAGAPRFPEVTQEELAILSLQDLHEIALETLEGYKVDHPGSDQIIEQIKYSVLGYLLREPGFLLGEEDARTGEEIAEAVKTINILEQAAFRCAREDINPFYQEAIYNNLMLMQRFAAAHGKEVQAERVRGLYNGMKGQLALRKIVAQSRRFRQLGPDPETNPAGVFALDYLGGIDNLGQYLDNRDVLVAFKIAVSDELFEDSHVSGPNRTEVSNEVLSRLELETRSHLLNARNKNTLFEAEIIFSSSILPDLDPELSPGEAFRQLALPPKQVGYDIIRKIESRLPKLPR